MLSRTAESIITINWQQVNREASLFAPKETNLAQSKRRVFEKSGVYFKHLIWVWRVQRETEEERERQSSRVWNILVHQMENRKKGFFFFCFFSATRNSRQCKVLKLNV